MLIFVQIVWRVLLVDQANKTPKKKERSFMGVSHRTKKEGLYQLSKKKCVCGISGPHTPKKGRIIMLLTTPQKRRSAATKF